MNTSALERLVTPMRTMAPECPHGHPIEHDDLRLTVDLGVGREYVDVRCRRCPSYRGRYRLDKLAEHAAAGHRIYRLPG